MGNFLAKVAPDSLLSNTFCPPPATFDPSKDLPDLSNKIIVVTGGNAGIGYCTSREILRHNPAKLYIASRDRTKTLAAIENLEKETGKRAEFLELDLSDLDSVRKAAEEFLKKEDRLDVLFNNAGVMTPPLELLTKEKYDLQWGTNAIGHYFFTQLLISALLRSFAHNQEPARIINTSSVGHQYAPSGGFEWESLKASTDEEKKVREAWIKKKGMMATWLLYGQSKLANIILSNYWAREHPGLLVSAAVHPGGIRSELQRHSGQIGQVLTRALLFPTEKGALSMLFAGFVAPADTINGTYLIPWARVGKATSVSSDLTVQKELLEYMENEIRGH